MEGKARWSLLRSVIAIVLAAVSIFTGHQLHDLIVEGSEVVRARFGGVEPSIALPIYAFFIVSTLLIPYWLPDRLGGRARMVSLVFFALFSTLWSYLGIVVGGGPHLYRLVSWLLGARTIGAENPWLDLSGALQFLIAIPLANYALRTLLILYILLRRRVS